MVYVEIYFEPNQQATVLYRLKKSFPSHLVQSVPLNALNYGNSCRIRVAEDIASIQPLKINESMVEIVPESAQPKTVVTY